MSKKGKLKKGKLKKEIKKIIKETYLKESLNESYYCNGAGQNASSHPGCRIHGEPCINWDENTAGVMGQNANNPDDWQCIPNELNVTQGGDPLSPNNLTPSSNFDTGTRKPNKFKQLAKLAARNMVRENSLLLESYYCNTYNQNGVSSVQNSKCMQCAQQNGGHNCSCFGEDANGDVFEGTLQNDTGTYEGWYCGSVGGPTTNIPLDTDIMSKTVMKPSTSPNMPSTSIDRMMREATENILKND